MKHLLTIVIAALALNLSAQEVAPEDLVNNANNAVSLKDFKGAYELYTQAFSLYENKGRANEIKPEFIYNAGYCAQKAGLNDEAIPHLQKAIAAGVYEAKPYIYLANAYKAKKDNDNYEKTLEEGLAKYANDATLKKLMANVYVSKGNEFYKEGNNIKKAANESGLNASDTVAFYAEYAKADAEFAKALPLIEKAYQYDSKNKNALKILFNLYTGLDRKEDADRIKAELDALQK